MTRQQMKHTPSGMKSPLPELNHVVNSTLTQFFPLPNVVHFVDRECLLLHRKEEG